jgi:hypothetical protein
MLIYCFNKYVQCQYKHEWQIKVKKHTYIPWITKLSRSDIPELVVPAIRISSVDGGMLFTRKLLNQVFPLVKLKSSFQKFYGRNHDLVNCYRIYVTNDHEYVPLVVSNIRSFPHWWLITRFVTRVTRQVPLVEHELLTLPEHQSSPHDDFTGIRVARSLVFCVVFCTSLFFLLVECCLSFDLSILIAPLVSSNSA